MGHMNDLNSLLSNMVKYYRAIINREGQRTAGATVPKRDTYPQVGTVIIQKNTIAEM
jgi:hypothetical protein